MAEKKAGKKVQSTMYWDADVYAALEKHDKQTKTNNMTATANDAVRYALFPEYRDDRDKDVVKLMQDIRASLYEHRTATARDFVILTEGFFQFVDVYFEHTHSIPKNERAAAEAQAKARLNEFMEELVQKVQNPKRKKQEIE